MRRARKDVYPSTNTFKYINVNPHNRINGDCVARAVSSALGQSWETTVLEMTTHNIGYGLVFNDKAAVKKYLEFKGWTMEKQPKKEDNTRYTGREFCKLLKRLYPEGRPVVAYIGSHHVTCFMPEIVDNKIAYRCNDHWDCTANVIGNWWHK